MEEFKKLFTEEEIERLRVITLERSIFYKSKIIDDMIRKLKTQDEELFNSLKSDIDFYSNYTSVLNKFYDFLRNRGE